MLKNGENLRNKKKGGVSALFHIYLLILFITIILFCTHSLMTLDTPHSYVAFNTGWVTADGIDANLEKVQGSICVTKEIPEIEKNDAIFFRVKNLNVKVYLGNELYKDYGKELLAKEYNYKTPGTYYVEVPLQPSDVGKQIKLDIECPYKNDSSCTITKMYFGDLTDIYRDEINSKIFGFGICIVLIVAGLCFIVIIIPMTQYDVEIGHSLLYLGLFAVFVGIWSLAETKLLQLLTGQAVFVHYLNNLSLLIAVLPLFIFFSKRHSIVANNDKIAYIVGALFIVSFVVSVILHYTGLYDLHETVKLTQCCLIISVLFTFYYAYSCFRAKKHDIAFIGLFVIAFCAGLDLIFYYKQLTPDNSAIVRIGVLGYVLVLGVQLIAEYIRVYKRSLKAADWRKMALTDSLTGLFNRTAFTEHVSRMDSAKTHNECMLVVFDLNDLKGINDTYGHSFGDMAIIEAAERIRLNFEQYGNCYRIGGDEFVCIFDKNISMCEMENVCAKFLNDIKVFNDRRKTHRKYELAVAFGYAPINYDKGITCKLAFDTADAEMYSMKLELKRLKQ